MLNKRTESFFKVIKMLRTKCKYRIGGWDCLWWSAVKGGSKHIKVFNTDLKVVKTGASLLSSESFVAALVHSNLMLLLHIFFFFCTVGTVSSPVPDDLRGWESSNETVEGVFWS